MIDTGDALVQEIGDCRALDAEQLKETRRDLLPRFTSDPRGLATALLKRHWLTPFQINRLFAGRGTELVLDNYVLLERLGEGGMGQVFKARNWKLDKVVALKLIRKDLLTNKTVVGRFEREVAATAQLDHPNIIRAYDAGRTDEGLFIVMEYVEGIDLGRLVKEKGRVPSLKACEYIRQAALGLQHAHEKGLIHRDIKPPNLLLAAQGEVIKILDLGLARIQDSTDFMDQPDQPALTQLGVIVGTVDFIAPEQARDSRTVDIRADLYSLGCTFLYLLTGRVPYPGGTPTEKLIKHALDPLPSMLDVPAAVRGIVLKLMAKKPAERYQTPAELVEALSRVLEQPERLQPRSAATLPMTVPLVQLQADEGKVESPPAPARQGGRGTARVAVALRLPQTKTQQPILEAQPSVNRPTPPPRLPVVQVLEEIPQAVPLSEKTPPASRLPRSKTHWLCLVAAVVMLAITIAFPLLRPAPKTQGDASTSTESTQTGPESSKEWDGVVREFLILGPQGRDVIVPVEMLEDPLREDGLDGPTGSKFRWKAQKVDNQGALKVTSPGWQRKPSILFAFVQIYSPSNRKSKMLLGSADAVRIWVNGTSLLETQKVHAQPRPDEHEIDVTLKAGWNVVMVRLGARAVRPFELYLSFKGEPGLRAALNPES
jgi:serine/threonine-protein kinase